MPVNAKLIVRADALFEAALGLLLVVGGASAWLSADDFPAPVGRPLIVAFGCALLLVAAVLWGLARAAVPNRLLRTLAAANLAAALLAIAWLLTADGFSTAGSIVTLATVVGLAILAAAQLLAARAPAPRPAPTAQ